MNRLKINKRHIVPLLAAIYALISVQNVAHFFERLNHGTAVSWTAGLAIGATLVILAHFLAETPMSDRSAFYGLLGVTLVFVTLTTIIQGSNYSNELGAMGYLFALVLAGAGELALPIAYAVAEGARARREVTEAGQTVERIAAQTIVGVMETVDTARAKKQAERRIESLILAHVNATVSKLMPIGPQHTRTHTSAPEAHLTDTAAHSVSAADATPQSTANDQIRHDGRPTIDVANEARAAERAEKVAAIVPLLKESGPMGVSAIAAELGVHRDTARRYLTELEQLFCVVNTNRKWQLAAPVSWPTLPQHTVEEIHLNGVTA